jgi:hypothetical protein
VVSVLLLFSLCAAFKREKGRRKKYTEFLKRKKECERDGIRGCSLSTRLVWPQQQRTLQFSRWELEL